MHNKCCNLDYFVLFSRFDLTSRLSFLMNIEVSSGGKISFRDNRVPDTFIAFDNFELPVVYRQVHQLNIIKCHKMPSGCSYRSAVSILFSFLFL